MEEDLRQNNYLARMIKRLLLLLPLAGFVISCSTTRVTNNANSPRSKNTGYHNSASVQSLLKVADSYLNTPYKYGGFTSSGMDCSGLVYVAFQSQHITLPRISRDQATAGHEISLREVRPGDLLYFATGGSSQINHTGIVHDISASGEIRFIHSSTSKGVMISSMNLDYWKKAFRGARRIL